MQPTLPTTKLPIFAGGKRIGYRTITWIDYLLLPSQAKAWYCNLEPRRIKLLQTRTEKLLKG